MRYETLAQERHRTALAAGDITLLAIETSCDETAAAVVRNGREILSNIVFSQIPLHTAYGGVVPEIASRSHVEKIGAVVDSALKEAGADISGVAVTYGPGLVGALLAGVSFAKAYAFAKGLPLVAVHHIAGHVAANELSDDPPEKPYVCLVASGGHSHLFLVSEAGFTILAKTLDDAAGEALDKFARALGLPYPGGPNLERLALEGAPNIKLPKASGKGDGLDLSFSGLKTAALTILRKHPHAREADSRATEITQKAVRSNAAANLNVGFSRTDLAASFQEAVVDALCAAAIEGTKRSGVKSLALAGGVAANTRLRNELATRASANGLAFYCPDMALCTDNAAMIGAEGYRMFMKGELAGLNLNARATIPL